MLLTTHYMDEVEALADKVAVLNNAQIVATGTPASLGGRDSGAVTIRFALPDGIAASDLPVAINAESDGLVEIRTEDELRCASCPQRLGSRTQPSPTGTLGHPGSPWKTSTSS